MPRHTPVVNTLSETMLRPSVQGRQVAAPSAGAGRWLMLLGSLAVLLLV